MNKIAVFYGSSSGNTRAIADWIAQKMTGFEVSVFDVARAAMVDLNFYSRMIFGVSTWGGGTFQKDWDDFIKVMDKVDMQGKRVAIFGLGDQQEYPDNFADGVGLLHAYLQGRGCVLLGRCKADGYQFNQSKAYDQGYFVGLVLDEDTQPLETETRLDQWLDELKNAL